MALRTSGVGTERKLEIWDQYGVKKYDFSPSRMVTPGPVLFEFEKLLLSDTADPGIGAVLFKNLDQTIHFRNALDTDEADLFIGGDVEFREGAIWFVAADPAEGARNPRSIKLSGKDYPLAGALAALDISLESYATPDSYYPEGYFRVLHGTDVLLGLEGPHPSMGGGVLHNISVIEGVGSLFGLAGAGNGLYIYGNKNEIKLSTDEYQNPETIVTDYGGEIEIFAEAIADSPIIFRTPNAAKNSKIDRLKLAGGADVADAVWAATLQSGLKLKDALDANFQQITNLLDPTAAQDGATKAYVDTHVVAGGGGAYGTAGDVTVAAGAITVTGHHYKVDAVGAADLNTVTAGAGVAEGWMVVLRAKDIANPITCKDGVGNLRLQSDFTLDSLEDSIMIIYDGVNWLEVARSNNS